MATLLVIEDEEVLAKNVRRALQKVDHIVHLAITAAEGERLFAELSPDLTLLDLRLPDGSGLDVLERLRSQKPGANVLMMTAHATVEDAVKAIKLGARDYLQKPLHMDDLRHAVARALEESQLKQEVEYYRSRESRGSSLDAIVGDDPGIRELRARVRRLCDLPAGASAPTVLITGETGTGKGLVSRVLHYNGARAERPFIEVNCAAIPENLVESELFGHERGAFTDARTARPGLFQAADKGTLFLDEIGCVPMAIQAKILKALEEKTVRPIGAAPIGP
jgi:DNA-binding NtrC family response regulator